MLRANYYEYYINNNQVISINKVEKKLGKKLKHGDVVCTGSYRDVGSYIVYEDEDDKLFIANPDYSHSGHLTIPLKITEKLDNALEYYKGFDYSHIELSKNDVFITKIFKTQSDILDKGEFTICCDELWIYYKDMNRQIKFNYEDEDDSESKYDINMNQTEIENLFKTAIVKVKIDNRKVIGLSISEDEEVLNKIYEPTIDWNLIIPSDKWTISKLYSIDYNNVMPRDNELLNGAKLTGPVDELDELKKRISKMKFTNVI